MIQLNTQSEFNSDLAARYYIAQHMPDVMRKETRNIGVLVRKGDSLAAKFFGEKEPGGALEGRSLKSFSDPSIYKMWIRYWRKLIEKSEDWESRLLDRSKMTFTFIPGGDVEGSGSDTADDICAFLYSTLVSSGGLKEALSESQEDDETTEVKSDLRTELRALKLMVSVAGDGVRHPVYENQHVPGTSSRWHEVTFAQSTDKESWIFEPLNLSTRQRKHAKERAGYLSFIFADIKNSPENAKKVNTQAVVSVNDEDRDDQSVRYALSLLKNHADIIDWNVPSSRAAFLSERELVGRAA